jgi:spore maturation protein CgeB
MSGLVLVGNPGQVHVGAHLHAAARQLGLPVTFCDVEAAFGGPAWLGKLTWHLAGHRPPRLRQFSQHVEAACRTTRPEWVLTTGLAPLEAGALRAIGDLGVRRLNFLTDDPFNPVHRAPWFLKALPLYDQVFSPRLANLDDLRRLGCRQVSYVPFAYAPAIHFPESPPPDDIERFAADVVFVGGADRDRVPVMATVAQAGVRLDLWGGYWQRHAETRAYARGHADPRTVRHAVAGAKVALCLVRRANRDGHAMRSYEVPAMGACMLLEDTPEHRAIFGEDGHAVVYFDSTDTLLERLRWLLAHDSERRRLAEAAHHVIVGGQNTYADRLTTMLGAGVLQASEVAR